MFFVYCTYTRDKPNEFYKKCERAVLYKFLYARELDDGQGLSEYLRVIIDHCWSGCFCVTESRCSG